MDKEQRKLLLVAVSVGVFLLVTVTAAIVVMSPKANMAETAFSSSLPYPSGIQPRETIDIQRPQEKSVSTNREDSNSVVAVDVNNGERLTISVPRPTTAAVPETPAAPPASASRPVAAVAPARQAAPAAQPAASSCTAAAKPAASASSTTAKTPAKAAPAASKTTNDFWVQTGAYSAHVRAEDAKELLASKGITSIIENRQIDGRTLYRVRLGPYTSEKEANYWLALVKEIDGFGDSQVRQTVRQQ
jgi:DedD protein